MTGRTFHIVDAGSGGHHGEFLWQILQAAAQQSETTASRIHLHAPSDSLAQVGLIGSVQRDISLHEIASGRSGLPAELFRSIQPTEEDGQVHCFFPKMNDFWPVLGRLRFATQVSGIWFAPRMAAWVHGGGLRERFVTLREISFLRRLCRRIALKKIYLLNDPSTARHMDRFLGGRGIVRPIADPVTEDVLTNESTVQQRGQLGLRANAIVFCLPGAIREGKGFMEALAAIADWQPIKRTPVDILVAGQPVPEYEARWNSFLAGWRAKSDQLRLVYRGNWQGPVAFSGCIQASDYLLLPYRNVLGSSGILGHAAKHRIPVIGSDKGLVGHLVRDYGLGGTVQRGSTRDLIRAMNDALQGSISLSEEGASRYVEQNSAERFRESLAKEVFVS